MDALELREAVGGGLAAAGEAAPVLAGQGDPCGWRARERQNERESEQDGGQAMTPRRAPPGPGLGPAGRTAMAGGLLPYGTK